MIRDKARGNARAFTLIELLIVVAIIAILAAIAVPNFLEAQVRSKVSRARADARSIATALESYAVDNNKYPIPRTIAVELKGTLDSAAQFVPGGSVQATLGGFAGGVTSPIAYLSTANIKDVFAQNQFDELHNDFFYQNIDYWYSPGVLFAESANPVYPQTLASIDPSGEPGYWKTVYGSYKMGSIGPDRDYSGGRNIYDPTNGTVSGGDIYRSQKRTEGGGF
ncbi:MAG: type II secretion system protein GspG [Candidatus Sumerlaeaceae bacterium]|nr:type II secretion system protein GspG [Candidatus Sumerlaeaceae bacterium]